MKVIRLVGLALSVGMLVLNTPVAFADASEKPKPSPTSSFDTAMLQYEIEIKKYRTLTLVQEKNRREITQRFMTAVTQANKIAKSGLASATTPESRATIIRVQKSSITLAVVARDSAILSLGPAPIQPIKPESPKVKSKAKLGKPSLSP